MKEEDQDLRQIFNAYHPIMEDSEDFMELLEKRLDAIEYVRQMQTKEQRRNRHSLIYAFSGGMVAGCMLYAMLMASDDTMPSIAVDTHFVLMRILSENSHLFVCMMLGTITIAGIIIGMNMWKEVFGLKNAQDISRALNQTVIPRTPCKLRSSNPE